MAHLPTPALIVLCGIPGSGKSTYANQHFPIEAIASIDRCFEMVSTTPELPHASWEAHEVFYRWIESRCALGLTTVADSTSLTAYKRTRLLSIARRYELPAYCVLMCRPFNEIVKNNSHSIEILERCLEKFGKARADVLEEGFDRVCFEGSQL